MRLFLDANILFLAGYSRASPVHDLLALAAIGACSLVTSRYAEVEARRNLELKGPDGWQHAFARASETLTIVGEAPAPTLALAAQAGIPDETDLPILAAAIHAQAAGLDTGDRRAFGSLFGHRVGGVEILTLRRGVESAACVITAAVTRGRSVGSPAPPTMAPRGTGT